MKWRMLTLRTPIPIPLLIPITCSRIKKIQSLRSIKWRNGEKRKSVPFISTLSQFHLFAHNYIFLRKYSGTYLKLRSHRYHFHLAPVSRMYSYMQRENKCVKLRTFESCDWCVRGQSIFDGIYRRFVFGRTGLGGEASWGGWNPDLFVIYFVVFNFIIVSLFPSRRLIERLSLSICEPS